MVMLIVLCAAQTTFFLHTANAQSSTYYVATNGNDTTGNGSSSKPWASIAHALGSVPDGSLILVRPGQYNGQNILRGRFNTGVTIRSEPLYQARLRNSGQVLSTNGDTYGITIEGFDMAHSGPGAQVLLVHISGGDVIGSGRDITLRNNILHDSYNNDILKVDGSATNIVVQGNIFYNQTGSDEHIDVNSANGVLIQDNIFFNDFAGSGRSNGNNTGSYIVIKDSGGDRDEVLGSRDITVRRNIFLNWQGHPGLNFVLVGEDGLNFYEAQNVLIENNLMLGNSSNIMRSPLGILGARNVTFRNNTVSGNLPSYAYAMSIASVVDNPRNEEIYFYNNIWSDPTGTMGSDGGSGNDFSDTTPGDLGTFAIARNLYWNGGQAIPSSSSDVINYTNDPSRIIADPVLPAQNGLVVPRWDAGSNRFADGSSNIREAFVRLVNTYGIPGAGSAAANAADPARAPTDDILGQPRSSTPDLGAVESGPSLRLRAAAGNEAIRLSWTAGGDLPGNTTWEIVYAGPAGSPASPVTGLPFNQRSLTLNRLTNYTFYQVTINARSNGALLVSDRVTVMPTDHQIFVPIIKR